METGKIDKVPKRLICGMICGSIGITLLLINIFTGLFYTFNKDNYYVRGPLYILIFAVTIIALSILLSFVIQYRKMIDKKIWLSIIIYICLPYLALILQIFFPNISVMNFSAWITVILLFWIALKYQNDELIGAAYKDITGLPNTYGYIYEADKIIHFGDISQYTGYYFDIVRMSNINNKYGKKIADDIISSYIWEIKNSVDKDEIVGRLGGNFFVALIKNENNDKFLKTLSDVSLDVEFNGKTDELHIAAVAGAYPCQKNIHPGQIISNAGLALNYAKNIAHKPYVFLDEKLEKEFARSKMIEIESIKAFENKEFEPFYQPKINSVNNMIIGAEALARWRHNGDLVAPLDFVPIMERNRSIQQLDFYILDYVCKDIKDMINDGIDPVQVSVNFSRKNFGNPILAEEIYNVVKKYDIPLDLIQIEITESVDEYPLSYLIGIVAALQKYGLSVAIDDFGTGSSSIKLLKEVKFDVLKIDKTFVEYNDEKEKKLLRDIIKMANDIGISVIAEGVEKTEQVDALKLMDCYNIQGFIYDKPLEKNEFIDKLKKKYY